MVHFRFVERLNETTRLFVRNPNVFVRGFIRLLAKKVRKALYAQGFGRHSQEEVHKLLADDLRSLSAILGRKSFFLGESPTSVDAAVFGFLAQVLWTAPDSPHEALLKTQLTNLDEYCWRMRHKYWHDWTSLAQST